VPLVQKNRNDLEQLIQSRRPLRDGQFANPLQQLLVHHFCERTFHAVMKTLLALSVLLVLSPSAPAQTPADKQQKAFRDRYGAPGSPRPARPAAPPAKAPPASSLEDLPYHPYRKVADRYYGLQPIYNWINAGRKGPCPMPAWISWYTDDPHSTRSYRAISVLADGILVEPKMYAPYGGGREGSPFFLKNYPNKNRITDGASFQFIALKTGTYQYEDSGGSVHTVELYDYGIPYDPAKLAAERQRTNSAALNPQP